jgi:autotransporter adhesin
VIGSNGVQVGGNTYINNDGLNANDKVISNVAAGNISANSTDAVNGSQLFQAGANTAQYLGGGSTVDGNGNVTAPSYTLTSGNPADGNTTAYRNVGDALGALNTAVNQPLTFSGDNAAGNFNRQLGSQVNLRGGAAGALSDSNIGVVANGTDTLNIQLAKELTDLTSAQFVDAAGNRTTVDSNGINITPANGNPVSLSENGLNNGGNVIAGVGAGQAGTDAVNVDQLNAAAAAATNKVAAGDNIEVAEVQNNDGSTTYTVATARNVNFDRVTAGSGDNQVVLNNSGVNVGGNTYISNDGLNANNRVIRNVAAGNVAAGSTDAVNGGQLHNTANSIANVFGGNAAVNPDGSVSMSNVGGTGANNVNDAIRAVNQAAVQAKTTVTAGDNIVVTPSTNADGSSNYTVATAKDLAVDSVTAGNTVINNGGITINNGAAGNPVSLGQNGLNNGGNTLTNVASGLQGKTVDQIRAEGSNSAQWNNAATVGDLTQVQGNVTNVNNTITNLSTTVGGADDNGNAYLSPNGELTDAGRLALKTYDVQGQTATDNNTVISAIKNMNEGGIKYFHTNDASGQKTGGAIADTHDSSASGAYATAIGYSATANAENAIALGRGAQALAENSISIGTGNIVRGNKSGAIGDPTIINGESSYSVGNDNRVDTNDTFVLGNNVTQTMNNSVILGSQSSATAVHTTAGGGNYTYAGANDDNVAGVNDVVGVVSVGTEGQTRQVQNVAAGVVSPTSTDAINGSQLYHTNQAINNIANHTVNIGNQLNQRIDEVGKKANAGVAGAIAQGSIPQVTRPGTVGLGIGSGFYGGQSAMALGVSSMSDNGNWIVKGNLSTNSGGHVGVGAGALYQW